MGFKDWMTLLGPLVVAFVTAYVGPALVQKLGAKNAKPATDGGDGDGDADKGLEQLRKHVSDLLDENEGLRAELTKRDEFRQIFWDCYDRCPELRKVYAQLMKERLEKK